MEKFTKALVEEIEKQKEEITSKIIEDAMVKIMPEVEKKIENELYDLAAKFAVKLLATDDAEKNRVVLEMQVKKEEDDKNE